ncbi:alpha-ketoglutarate-dependent dioxygenase alkB homolog 6 isoform X2 [Scyliorhinus canicula]|uniref:alpha-ketoglutarate-dependent dioxygenase alkB homolog 6 isoform X2 n=1 Tax=Scyliorhinus canicula TaxID=7830 RepID=UPI0018F3C71C|nr:alpha-ketoglutarate-dependent dioxygenase alkB homolog 6 isoform X2 [Scyliorhinus canicula]
MDTQSCRPCELECHYVHQAPATVCYIPNFITAPEENYLLQQVYNSPKPKWTQLSGRRLQNWGGLPHSKGMLAEKLPDWLDYYAKKISSLGPFEGKVANHVLVNEYNPGEGIMVYFPQTEENRYFLSLLLEPRSLLVLQDDMYMKYLHGIRPVMEDIVTEKVANLKLCNTKLGAVFRRTRRISLTIRYVPKVLKTTILLGR